MKILKTLRVVVGLGSIGFYAAAKALKTIGFAFEGTIAPKFAHSTEYYARNGARTITLVGCYHPSRQNTNTGVLTASMLDSVFERTKYLASRQCSE
jgi:uracil-DNA glycosylase